MSTVRVLNNDVKIFMEYDIVTEERIPVIYCYHKTDKPLPIVIFQHGMFGDKIIDLNKGIRLAQEGFFAVIPDARLHGDRIVTDYSEYFCGKDKLTNVKRFFNVIKDTTEDISRLIDHLKDDPRVDLNRIGMSGISMGGFVTFSVVATDKRIKVAAPMLASPDWAVNTESIDYQQYDEELKEFAKRYNPINSKDKIASIPLLVQNAIEDNIVSIKGVRRLDDIIKKEYKGMIESYNFIEYTNIGHEVVPIMIDRIIEWFKKYL